MIEIGATMTWGRRSTLLAQVVVALATLLSAATVRAERGYTYSWTDVRKALLPCEYFEYRWPMTSFDVGPAVVSVYSDGERYSGEKTPALAVSISRQNSAEVTFNDREWDCLRLAVSEEQNAYCIKHTRADNLPTEFKGLYFWRRVSSRFHAFLGRPTGRYNEEWPSALKRVNLWPLRATPIWTADGGSERGGGVLVCWSDGACSQGDLVC